jgi:hypothetical protein
MVGPRIVEPMAAVPTLTASDAQFEESLQRLEARIDFLFDRFERRLTRNFAIITAASVVYFYIFTKIL